MGGRQRKVAAAFATLAVLLLGVAARPERVDATKRASTVITKAPRSASSVSLPTARLVSVDELQTPGRRSAPPEQNRAAAGGHRGRAAGQRAPPRI